MALPSFAEELKFQTGGATRIVSFSLKARAALTMAGHKADAATWFDSGTWGTSSPYGVQAFIEEQAKSHPAKADFGKAWTLSLPQKVYWYDEKDLGNLFAHLDQKVGRGNYIVALTADHGVVPIPEDMQRTGVDAGLLHLPELQERIEKALDPFHYPKPAIASVNGSDIYFAPGVYDKLQNDHAAMHAALYAALDQPALAAVYRSEELRDRPPTQSPALRAF